jgi:hypothetical protein
MALRISSLQRSEVIPEVADSKPAFDIEQMFDSSAR